MWHATQSWLSHVQTCSKQVVACINLAGLVTVVTLFIHIHYHVQQQTMSCGKGCACMHISNMCMAKARTGAPVAYDSANVI